MTSEEVPANNVLDASTVHNVGTSILHGPSVEIHERTSNNCGTEVLTVSNEQSHDNHYQLNHDAGVTVLIEVPVENLPSSEHEHHGDSDKPVLHNSMEPPIPLDADLGSLIHQHESTSNAISTEVIADPSTALGVTATAMENLGDFSSTALLNVEVADVSVNFAGHSNADVVGPSVAVKQEPLNLAERDEGLENLTSARPGKRSLQSVSAGTPIKRRKYSTNNKKVVPRWNDMLFTLLQYRCDHGNCMVPFKSGGELGKWVATQRAQYLALHKQQQNQSDMPEDSVTHDDGGSKVPAENGDINDDQNAGPNGTGESLDCTEALNEERIKVLSNLGFVWDVVQADNDARWKRRFDELVEYKSVHNHCNVPQSTDLGKWVKMQRENKHETDLKRAGKTPIRKKPKPCLSEERISKLESIGFQWRVAKPAVGWEKRYQQLVEYKEAHGDCNVPQSYPPDKPFGRWVMKQRCQQSLKLRGEKSQLTDEREAKLTALGFCWVAPGFSKKTVTLPGADEDTEDETAEETNVIADIPAQFDGNSLELSQGQSETPQDRVIIQVMEYQQPEEQGGITTSQEEIQQSVDTMHGVGHQSEEPKQDTSLEQSVVESQAGLTAVTLVESSVPDNFTTWTV